MTWIAHETGVTVLCNRDERSSRASGRPPTVRSTAEGVRFVAPTDVEAGGTWIAATEHGLGLCVLNGDADRAGLPAERAISRGAIIGQLAAAPSVERAARRLLQLELRDFRPFQLLLISQDGPSRQDGANRHVTRPRARVATWDGATLVWLAGRGGPSRQILSSSSRDPARARRERLAGFARVVRAEDRRAAQLAFHRSHHPEKGPWSPCMHREDAATVSLTRLDLAESEVSIAYGAGPACTASLGAPVVLERPG